MAQRKRLKDGKRKTVAHLDHMNSPANILIGMGVTGEDEVKAIS